VQAVAFHVEFAKYRARGIRSFAFCEETSPELVGPGSAKDLAARAKFTASYRPGDGYGYSSSNYRKV